MALTTLLHRSTRHPRLLFKSLSLSLLIAMACITTTRDAQAAIAVAGDLLVELQARDTSTGAHTTYWANTGTLGGTFYFNGSTNYTSSSTYTSDYLNT